MSINKLYSWVIDYKFNLSYLNNYSLTYNYLNLLYNKKIEIPFLKNKILFYFLNKKKFIMKTINYYNIKLYIIILYLIGVGYNIKSITKNIIKLNLGYSHYIIIKFLIDFKINIEDTQIKLIGFNKFILKQVSSYLKTLKVLDVYKAKGFHYALDKLKYKICKNKK